MNTEKLIENILDTLGKQKFDDWYSNNGNFGKWITGDLTAPSQEQIKAEIKQLFHIE
jgi:hypothetical protein